MCSGEVTLIEIHELTKYYGERRAVGPLSFTIEQGEVVGLLGLNGAGKTTTLRMLATDLLPTSGRMRISGIDLVEQPERLRAKIGYLPDRPPLYGEMTVREFLLFAGRLRGAKDLARRVPEVIEITDVGEYADEPISTLSHGFRQRVGIAQAIVHRPSLLLLDEPIGGLDPVQIVEMRELVRSLRGDHTIVLSSHILSEISETCDRLLVLREGEIIAKGTQAALAKRVATVKSFVLTARAPGHDDPGAQLAALVKTVEGVKRVKQLSGGTISEDVATLQVDCKSDLREAVCRVLVEAGCGLLELERRTRELEDVFLMLTAPGGAA